MTSTRVRQTPPVKPLPSVRDLSQQSRNLGSDIKRIFLIAAVCLVVLVVVWLLLR